MTRRSAIGLAGAAVLAGAAAGAAAAGAAEARPGDEIVRFSKPEPETAQCVAADALTLSADVSADGRAVTMLSDKLRFESAANDEALSKTWTAALRIPQKARNNPGRVACAADVRGHARKDAAARVAVTLHTGGATETFDLPFGDAPRDEVWQQTVVSDAPVLRSSGGGASTATAGRGDSDAGDGPPQAASLSYYPVVETVVIQRATSEDRAAVAIDPIDVIALSEQ